MAKIGKTLLQRLQKNIGKQSTIVCFDCGRPFVFDKYDDRHCWVCGCGARIPIPADKLKIIDQYIVKGE